MTLEDSATQWEDTEFDPVSGQTVFSFDGTDNRFTIRPLVGAVNDTPYWIMRVPRQLIVLPSQTPVSSNPDQRRRPPPRNPPLVAPGVDLWKP